MPGPPVPIDSHLFLPIVILIPGKSNQGKSTLANALNRDEKNIAVIHLDSWCYTYFNKRRFDLKKTINHIKQKNPDRLYKILEYFLTQINLISNTYKIYIYEGVILEQKTIYDGIVNYYLDKKYKVWTVKKN